MIGSVYRFADAHAEQGQSQGYVSGFRDSFPHVDQTPELFQIFQ
jgi:hypothetical protein